MGVIKRRALRILGVMIAIVVVIAAIFAHRNLRGIGPSILPPPRDIAQELLNAPVVVNTTDIPLALPPGFSISIFANDLGSPRVLAQAPDGALLVSIPPQGRIVALRDRNGDGVAEDVRTVAHDLRRPHGLAFRCVPDPDRCQLYVAETDALSVFDYDAATGIARNRRALLDLPAGGGHWTRTIMFRAAPHDAELLISIGSSCNVCVESDEHRAVILAYDTANGTVRTFARGLRNSVFLALHPVTGQAWATEMGRDLLGDDLPPDEVNVIGEGADYGWPYCYGKNVRDPFAGERAGVCNDQTPSHIDLPAHVAPLGLAFIPEEGWPEDWWHDLLIAEHGSWNRSEPTGYAVVRYDLDAQGNVLGSSDLITGWRTGNRALGRPVDIIVQPSGTMFISDDKAGVVYRATYHS